MSARTDELVAAVQARAGDAAALAAAAEELGDHDDDRGVRALRDLALQSADADVRISTLLALAKRLLAGTAAAA